MKQFVIIEHPLNEGSFHGMPKKVVIPAPSTSLVIPAAEMTKCITFLNAPYVVIYGNINSL